MLTSLQCYRWSRILYWVPVLLIFKGALLHLNGVYIGKNGDSSQFIWYLGWFWHAVLTGQNPLVSHMLNYPYGVNLIANTGIVAESVLFGPFFYLVGPVFSFNILMLVDLLLIGVIGANIFDHLKVRPWLADFGAMLFGLSAFVVNQLVDGHINLISGYVLVLALISVIIRGVQGRPRPVFYGSLLSLFLILLFYTSLEMFAISAIVLVCGLVMFGSAYQMKAWEILKSKLILPFLIMSVIALIVVMPGLYEFFCGINSADPGVPVFTPNVMVTFLSSFVIPSGAQLVFLPFYIGYNAEVDAYLGIPAIILIIMLAVHSRERFAYCLLGLAVLVSLFSMGGVLRLYPGHTGHMPLPWGWLEGLPLISDILPARLMAFADIAFIMFIIIGVENMISKKNEIKHISIILLMLTAVTWYPNIPFWSHPPAVHAELQRQFTGQPVAIIEPNFYAFSSDMEFLASGHYAFPVTNAYQFPYMTGITSGKKYVTLFIFIKDYQEMSLVEAKRNLQKFVELRKPRYIVLLSSQLQLPKVLGEALNQLFGAPMQKEGVEIWLVKN